MIITHATFFERLESTLLTIATLGLLLAIPLFLIRKSGSTTTRQIALESLPLIFLTLSGVAIANARPYSVTVAGQEKPLIFSTIWITGSIVCMTVLLWKNLSFPAKNKLCPVPQSIKLIVDSEARLQGISSPRIVCPRDAELLAAVHGSTLYVSSQLAEKFAEPQIRVILRHELAHIRHQHWPRTFAVAVFTSIFWWHPMAHWLKNELNVEREIHADAIAGAEDPLLYAETICQIVQQKIHTPALAIQCHANHRRWAALGSRCVRRPIIPAVMSILGAVLLAAPLVQPIRQFQVKVGDLSNKSLGKEVSVYSSSFKMRVSDPSSSRNPRVVLRSRPFQDRR